MAETSVAIMTRASQMLAEATTIQQAKGLKDLALTAQDWARRKGLGEEAIQHCRKYALLAERKMGEMLAQTPRAEGGRPAKTSNAQVLVSAPTLSDLGLTKRESAEAQKLAALPEPVFHEVVEGKRSVAEAIAPKPHVAHNSGENEWYTPPEYIEAARRTMGSIDTDPASSEAANRTVKAKRYFTIESNGLVEEWPGNVWLNPPYTRNLVELFCDKLLEEFASRRTRQACLLVNNATETAWCQKVLSTAHAVCFVAGRIRYLDRTGQPAQSPLQGQVIFYFGREAENFCKNFDHFGVVLPGEFSRREALSSVGA